MFDEEDFFGGSDFGVDTGGGGGAEYGAPAPDLSSSDIGAASSPSSFGDTFLGSLASSIGTQVIAPALTKAAGGALTSWMGIPAHTSNPTVSGSTNFPVAATGMPTGSYLQNNVRTPTYGNQNYPQPTSDSSGAMVPILIIVGLLVMFGKKLFGR